jgi:hypothetical protein
MGSKRKKLNELNIEKKLDFIDRGVSEPTAVQFSVAKSTVGNIKKNRNAILKSWEGNFSF